MEIREPTTENDWRQYYQLRTAVLSALHGHFVESLKDALEEDSFHLMAVAGERCVGVGRAHFNHSTEGRIRFMAVDAEYRGRGIGRSLIEGLEVYLLRNSVAASVLNARKEAMGFYRKHGYELVDEDELLRGDVELFKMRKPLMR